MKSRKTILIVGAKSDIAIAVATKFAFEGYNIQFAGREILTVDSFSTDLSIRYGISTSIHELDILQTDTFSSFFNSLEVLPDIVFCAVGTLGNQIDDQKSVKKASIVFKTNYEGPSLLLSEAANIFEKRKSGSIIGISSVAGLRGRATNYIYGSAKSGFIAFLSGLRNRLHKSNVSVLDIRPGFIETKMIKGMKTSKFLTQKPVELANIIFANRYKSKFIYSSFKWKIIMSIIISIPENIFKRLKI